MVKQALGVKGMRPPHPSARQKPVAFRRWVRGGYCINQGKGWPSCNM